MSDPESSNPFDLRFLPSWLKEETTTPSYADYSGEESPRRERSDRRDGGGNFRPGGRPPQNRDRRDGPAGPGRPGGTGGSGGGPRPGSDRRPDSRGPRPEGGNRTVGGPGRPQQSGPGAPQRQQSRGPQGRSGGDRRDQPQRPREAQIRPAPVTIKFFPETIALEKVTEQLKSAPIAYPLFAVAKMFLQRPERHLVQIAPLPDATLYRLADTPFLSTDRTWLENIAFGELWKKFFRVDVTEGPEIKGNFTSVARSSLSGRIFGPTNHHQFQTLLHKEYEERFSRRMSFAEYRSCIETTNDPAAIEQWKNDARRVESYVLIPPAAEIAPQTEAAAAEKPDAPTAEETNEATPVSIPAEIEPNEAGPSESADLTPGESVVETEETPAATPEQPDDAAPDETGESPAPAEAESGVSFATRAEAEAYFRTEILPTLLVETQSEILAGNHARDIKDRHLAASVRLGWETEARYPLGLVNQIRVKFNEQNLHIFKFKKRVLLISSLKPAWLNERSESLSPSIRGVLQVVQAHPGIDRKGLAEKILADYATATDEEKQTRKQSLIGDLFWLVRQGHVIEFSDGTFDLPVGPKGLAQDDKELAESKADTPQTAPESNADDTPSEESAETSHPPKLESDASSQPEQ